jgi:stearoyl-CoA desaturase (delta-9 desaturase)
VAWQHHYYDRLLIIMAFIVPSLVSGIGWGDWNGGFVYAGCLRMFVVQQSTFCINSLGHWLGDQPYQTDKSPKNNLIVAFLTLGEGYHNFHHEFPNDYRNGINHSDFDPTKWFIYTMTLFGLAYDLKRFPSNEIQKGYHQQCQKSLQIKSAQIDWGTPEEELPLMKRNDFTDAKRSLLTCIDGIVYDITGFAHEHPGGQIILSWVGKDASEAFNGGIYQHSNAAHNLLSQMRIARLEA